MIIGIFRVFWSICLFAANRNNGVIWLFCRKKSFCAVKTFIFTAAHQITKNMQKYFSRLVRYFLLLVLMIIILLVIAYLRRGDGITELKEAFLNSRRIRLFLFVVIAYSLIYPLLVFGKRERYINGKFRDNRDRFIKAFAEQNYVPTKEKDTILEFRKKSGFSRMMSLGQDKIEVDFSGNPVIIDGLRKELRRLDTSLDMNLLKQD